MVDKELVAKDKYRAEFLNYVSELLLPNHHKGTALLMFIRSWSFKWNLEHKDPFDTLVEAIKRGIEYIDTKELPINSPEAWLRGTSLNILRDEIKKSCRQEEYLKETAQQQSCSGNPLIKVELIEQLEKLQEALQLLSGEEQELIQLRFISGKTYQEVQKLYSLRDEEERVIPLATLRKRESRALQKLRSIFFRLYQIEKI